MLTFSQEVNIRDFGMPCMAILGQPHRKRCTPPEHEIKKKIRLYFALNLFVLKSNLIITTPQNFKTKSISYYSKHFIEPEN